MYFLAQNNEKTGPFTLEQLRTMWREGGVYPQTLYWEDGMQDWEPLGRSAAGRLGLTPSTPPTAPAMAAATANAPLLPSATSHEPSAYDLPAGHLPAGPVNPPQPAAAPVSTGLPAAAAPPDAATGSLIAPTRLPGGGVGAGGAMNPAGPGPLAAASNEMPPAAYLSLIFSLAWPFLLIFHILGVLVSMGMIVAAVVCGHTARAAIKQSGGRLPGWGVATAGMTVGYLCLALGLALILLLVAFMIFGIYSVVSNGHGG